MDKTIKVAEGGNCDLSSQSSECDFFLIVFFFGMLLDYYKSLSRN